MTGSALSTSRRRGRGAFSTSDEAAGAMNCQTLGELAEILAAAGDGEVVVHGNWRRGWFCTAGVNPVGEDAVGPRTGRPGESG